MTRRSGSCRAGSLRARFWGAGVGEAFAARAAPWVRGFFMSATVRMSASVHGHAEPAIQGRFVLAQGRGAVLMHHGAMIEDYGPLGVVQHFVDLLLHDHDG